MRKRVNEARFRTAGILGRGLLGGLAATWRLRVESEENWLRFQRKGRAVILVFWHEQLLPLVPQIRGTAAHPDQFVAIFRRFGERVLSGGVSRQIHLTDRIRDYRRIQRVS